MAKKFFWSKIYRGQKKFWVKNNFGSKKFFGQKILLVKNFFGQKFFLGQKIFWVEIFFVWRKKILSQKNFVLIDLNLKFVLSKEKTGLTQGGEYMTPPQKIVGLKLWWIVVSFAW